MLWTAEFGGLPEDQEICPWENKWLCLMTVVSRDKPDYSLPTPKGRIWIAWESHTKTRYNDLASTDHRSTQGRFSLLILTLKILILFPIPSPTSPSQTQTLPHYILVKSKKTGGKLRKNFKKYFQEVYEVECWELNPATTQSPDQSHQAHPFSLKKFGKSLPIFCEKL